MAVDAGALVQQIERAGIRITRAQYVESHQRVFIEFASADDASSLMNVIARYVPESDPFHARIFGERDDPKEWRYFVRPVDVSQSEMPDVDVEGLNWKPSARIRLVVSMAVPPEDVPILAELIRDYNAR